MSSEIRPARVLALARRTLSCPTAPFREGAVMAWVLEFVAERRHLAVRVDRDGNMLLSRRGVRQRTSPLVLSAHMDHPGFRARASHRVNGRWTVSAQFLGGVRPEFFRGARALFFSPQGEVRAAVTRVRRDRASGELEASLRAAREVPAGAFGMWDLPPFRRAPREPGVLESRAVDDLAGVAAALALLDVVDRIDPRRQVDVRALFTRGEEVGFVGALAVARGRRLPQRARIVSLEASKAFAHAPQGAGPILRVGDRTSSFDDRLTRWMARVATALAGPRGSGFRWQRRLMDGGTCEATAFQLYGYRSAALCVPLGNYHNMSEDGAIRLESIHASDLVGLARFLEGLVKHDGDCPGPGVTDPLRRRLDRGLSQRRRDLARDPFA
ncbi:MAG TPA: M20/M25/M40 family metallo-hydrolase [Myxococcota bacterium]|nr:M20/M25/M40 family metallo-hydrolase [Myxococcota bacterium]